MPKLFKKFTGAYWEKGSGDGRRRRTRRLGGGRGPGPGPRPVVPKDFVRGNKSSACRASDPWRTRAREASPRWPRWPRRFMTSWQRGEPARGSDHAQAGSDHARANSFSYKESIIDYISRGAKED